MTAETDPKPLFLIGIDGATPDLIERWRDDLPNIRELMESGVSARLESTLPPTTAPAWNSMFTGKNPGKHGVFGFYRLPFYGGGGLAITNLSHQDSPSLWDHLGKHGKRVGVVNVPTAFPPARVNGFMVSGGLLTPLSPGVIYTHPPELRQELDRVCGGYDLRVTRSLNMPGREEQYLAQFLHNIDNQLTAVKHLMRTREWDFMAHVFFVTDSVQHYCWHHMDPAHPSHDPRRARMYGDAIKSVYQRVDEAVGELRTMLPGGTNVVVVSDHGGAPCYGEFFINEWLRQQGFLALKPVPFRPGRAAVGLGARLYLRLKFWNPLLVESLLRAAPRRLHEVFARLKEGRDEAAALLERIDWPHTQAYALGSPPQVFVNLQGREPGGTVPAEEYEDLRDRLSELLLGITAPGSGKRAVSAVRRREEVYSGPHTANAPDLLLDTDGTGYMPCMGFGKEMWRAPSVRGWHSKHGVFIASGPDIRRAGGHMPDASIYDVTPTVLHMMGLPIPQDMDGRVIREALALESGPGGEAERYEDPGERVEVTEQVLAEEQREIRRRLAGLGYL